MICWQGGGGLLAFVIAFMGSWLLLAPFMVGGYSQRLWTLASGAWFLLWMGLPMYRLWLAVVMGVGS